MKHTIYCDGHEHCNGACRNLSLKEDGTFWCCCWQFQPKRCSVHNEHLIANCLCNSDGYRLYTIESLPLRAKYGNVSPMARELSQIPGNWTFITPNDLFE